MMKLNCIFVAVKSNFNVTCYEKETHPAPAYNNGNVYDVCAAWR